MIFQCGDLERALRNAELMPDARAHAEGCPACREQLYLWAEISRVAPQLHREWESDSLWPRIRAELAAEQPARPRLYARWGRWGLALAATVALALVLLPRRGPAPGGRELLTDAALQDVQQAEAAYARSIDKLAAAADPGMEQSASPLAAAYREKLVVLDAAIADLKNNVEQNRYNAYLRTELASLYGEKQKTLRDWMEHGK
jgi:hypothetical protein